MRENEKIEFTILDKNYELSIVELEMMRSILGRKKFKRTSVKYEGTSIKLHIADIIATTFDSAISVTSSEEEGTKYIVHMRTDIEVSD